MTPEQEATVRAMTLDESGLAAIESRAHAWAAPEGARRDIADLVGALRYAWLRIELLEHDLAHGPDG